MAYSGKTNWQNNEIVEASDMNRIEQGISDADVGLENVQAAVDELNDDVGDVATLTTADKSSTVNAINEVMGDLATHKADNMRHRKIFISDSDPDPSQGDEGDIYLRYGDESPIYGLKNKIINGNFDIWQRGITFESPTGGKGSIKSPDMWVFNASDGIATLSRQSFDQTLIPGARYFCRYEIPELHTTGYHTLQTRIEGAQTLSGKKAVLTFWAKADDEKPITIEFSKRFGSGGSSVVTGIGVTKILLSTEWDKYIVPVYIPPLASGITFGDGHNLCLNIWLSATSADDARTDSLGIQTGIFDFAQIQLEEGEIATPFEQRPLGMELALCQGYYEKSYDIDIVPGTETETGSEHQIYVSGTDLNSVRFKVTKCRTPTIEIYSDVTGELNKVHNNSTSSDIEINSIRVGKNGFTLRLSNAQTLGDPISFHWVARSFLA